MNILRQSFPTTDVMKVAGLNKVQFQNLFKSPAIEKLDTGSILSTGVRGKERLFSFYAMMAIVPASVFIKAGLPPRRAFELALRFGASNDLWDGLGSTISREMGLPCHQSLGDTYIVTNGAQDAVILRRNGKDLDAAFKQAQLFGEQSAPGRITLNASKLFENVMIALNQDPDAILDGAYPEDAN